jgi:hypothetical protein
VPKTIKVVLYHAMPRAHAVFDHEAAASASGDLAPPSLLAEFCCLVVVAVIGGLMWRWWQHHSRYEADALFFESVVKDIRTNSGGPRSAATGGLSRSASLVPQSLAAGSRTTSSSSSPPLCADDQSALFVSPSKPRRRRRSEAPDAQRLASQNQNLERLTQLMGTCAETSAVCDMDYARPKSRHRIPTSICVSESALDGNFGIDTRRERRNGHSTGSFVVDTCAPSPLAGPPHVPSTSTTPTSGPSITSSGSRYTAQLLKRRGSTAEGSVSPISRTLSRFSSASTIDVNISSLSPPVSRTHSDSRENTF